MKRWQTAMVQVCLICFFFFWAAVSAYCQRINLSVNAGEAFDRFGALPQQSGPEAVFDGEGIVLKSPDKNFGADVLAGFEVRAPLDTNNHANEIAVYGGVGFHVRKNFEFGFHGQVHRIYLPPSTVDGQVFNRARLSLVETPAFVQYKFGPDRHAFVRAEGAPEFSPRFKEPAGNILLNPNLDHGYYMRGSVGYNFGMFYVKGTYETRYFKFRITSGNPNDLYNWRSGMATGGVGITF